MKRIVLPLILLLLPLLMAAAPVTQEQAMQKAREFMGGHSKMAKSKMLKAARAPLKMQSAQTNPCYYVFNVGEQQGFVVVSGDDRTPAILGYSDKGSFDADKLPANMRKLLEEYEWQISLLDKYHLAQPKIALHESVEPFIKTTWNQHEPYNNFCPVDPYNDKLSVTGCAATAMAQVMNYYKYPDATAAVIPAYTTYSYGMTMKSIPKNTAIDWDNMLDSYDKNATEAQQNAVANLMSLCGQSLKMDYTNSSGSGTSARYFVPALTDIFSYDQTVHYIFRNFYRPAEIDSLVYLEIKHQRPVIYSGVNYEDEGHAFIIDGYSEGFYHVNWGWSGLCDGYFNLLVLDPECERGDNSVSMAGFNLYDEIILGIQPPVEGETEVSFEAVSLTPESFNVASDKKEFPRQADGSFSVPAFIEIFNFTSTTRSYEIGYALFNAQDEMLQAFPLFTKKNMAFYDGTSQNVVLTIPADLPDGEYTARVINRPEGTDEWLECPSFECRIHMTIKDNVISTVSLSPYDLSGTIECTTEAPQMGKRLTFEAKVTSHAGNCLYPVYLEVDGKIVGGTSIEVVSGETSSVILSYKPWRSGINKLRLLAVDYTFVAAEGTVNVKGVESAELLFNLDVKDLRPNNSVPHTNIEATVRIHNNSCNAYNKRIKLSLAKWDDEEEKYDDNRIEKEIDIELEGDADCEKVITFEGLTNNADYALVAAYLHDDDTYENKFKESLRFSTNEPVDGKEDMTYMIENPDFEWGDYGWVVDAVSGGNVRAGGTGDNICFEAWNNRQFDIHQTITGLPAGIYEIQVQGFYRNRRGNSAWSAFQNGGINVPVYVYLNNSATPLKNVFDEPDETGLYSGDFYTSPTGLNFPNDMATSAQAFSANMYRQSAFGLVMSENDEVNIGVKGATNQNNDSWAIWDNFKLIYLGFDPQYVRPALQQALATTDNIIGQMMGKTAYEKLAAILSQAKEAEQSSDGELMFNLLNQLYTANDEAIASIEEFQQLTLALEELQLAIDNYHVASEAVQQESADMLALITANAISHQYEDEDIYELVEQIYDQIDKLRMPNMEMATATNPVECTSLLTNPSFEHNGENTIDGWSGKGYINFGNDEFQKSALALEVYEQELTLYQLLFNIPNGYYAMQVSAFYRYGTPEEDAEHYRQGEQPEHAFIFMGNAEDETEDVHKPLVLTASGASLEPLSNANEWQYENGLFTPYDMVSSVAYFKKGYYQNKLLFNVTKNNLALGLSKSGIYPSDWVMMDDFRLFYYGTEQPSEEQLGIAPQTSSLKSQTSEYFDLSGRRLTTSQKGITIRRQQQSDGTVLVRKVIK